jgi:predicted dehydrogenase
MSKPIKIGVLGAARITPFSLISPAKKLDTVIVQGIAARDHNRAQEFANKHLIPLVFSGYDELINSSDIDAIYNPLPNSLHAEWTAKALQAGKHVLCEKPFTSNAEEASLVATIAQESNRICMEAFHWRYHPLTTRILELLKSGEIGTITRIETWMCVPLPFPSNIRYRSDLSGGAMMDVGAYAVSMLRHLSGMEPRVTSAQAKLIRPGVDRRMEAELTFENGASGHLTCSLWSSTFLRIQARIIGEKGSISVINPVTPQLFNWLTIKSEGKTRRERVARTSTYYHQLSAFSEAILNGGTVLTDPQDAIKNMRVIDDIYRAANLKPRGT